MTLRGAASGIWSRDRNTELLLLAGSAAFVLLAWRALDKAAFAMPAGSDRILTQFLLAALLGHLGMRIVAPRAAGQPYAIVLLLSAVGLAFVTRVDPDVAQTQVNWITVGIGCMVVTALFCRNYAYLRRYKYTAALATVLVLVATGLFGTTINGARLWFRVGGQTIQTTEFVKLFFIVFLAAYLADSGGVLSAPRMRFGGRTYSALPYIIPLALALGASIMVIGLLHDLGTIALLLFLVMASLYVATGRLSYVAGGVVLLVATVLAGYVMFDHVRVRVDVWVDPGAHAQTTGYQTLQSIYAIQAGGVTGDGLGLGHPEDIPVVATDYIFSAIAEELGLAGGIGVVLLYVLLLTAGLRIALATQDDFGRMLACCISLLLAIQAAVIIGGNLRIIPTTGITLPFISYGGSSLVVNFVLIGMLLGVSQRGHAQG
ncbi:MAG: FtsW/RodA/SpoVE family cell cycle protein [Tepidiformaceae bacterium]